MLGNEGVDAEVEDVTGVGGPFSGADGFVRSCNVRLLGTLWSWLGIVGGMACVD